MKINRISKILLVAILGFTTATMNGQAAILALIFGDKVASEKFNLSLNAGMTVSSNSLDNTKAMNGFNFGLGVNLKLAEKWYLKPEFRPLSPKGFKSTSSLNTGNPSFDAMNTNVLTENTLNYIDIPVVLNYEIFKNAQLGFGPQVSFLTKSHQKFHDSNNGVYDRPYYDDMNKTDFGVVTTFTYVLSTKRKGKGVNLKLQYYHGMTNLYKSTDSKIRTFSFGLEFPFLSDDIAQKRLKDATQQ